MNRIETVLENKKTNFEKVRAFGFLENGGNYTYHTPIAGGQLRLTVTIAGDGGVSTEVLTRNRAGNMCFTAPPGRPALLPGWSGRTAGKSLPALLRSALSRTFSKVTMRKR